LIVFDGRMRRVWMCQCLGTDWSVCCVLLFLEGGAEAHKTDQLSGDNQQE